MIVESIQISGMESLTGCPIQLPTHDWKPMSLADGTPAMRRLQEKHSLCEPRSTFTHCSSRWKLSEQIHSPPQLVPRVCVGGVWWCTRVDEGRFVQRDMLWSERTYLSPSFRVCRVPLSYTHSCWTVPKSLVNSLSIYVKRDISSQQSCLMDPSVVSKTSHFPPTFSSWCQGVCIVWILPYWRLQILCVCLEPKESKEMDFAIRSWPFNPPAQTQSILAQIHEKQMQGGTKDQWFY